MPEERKLLGEILFDRGLVTKDQIDQALAKQEKTHQKIGEILIEMGIVSEDDVTEALATQFDMEVVDLENIHIPQTILDLLPQSICKKHNVIPVSKVDSVIRVAITDPLDFNTMDNLRFILNSEIEPVLATREGIQEAIGRYFTASEESVDMLLQEFTDSAIGPVEEAELSGMEEGEEDAPVIKLVHMIISEAVKARASDVHIEPLENRIRIRYRVDGVCREIDSPPKRLQGAIISRVKIMSNMDIAEKRKPQDGRILIKIAGKDLDLRVSGLPGLHGESIVMRILDKQAMLLGLESLGFEEDDYKRFQRIIKRPNGIFLVTGPTGSGKTTTLYAALSELNKSDVKIITVEDPVEYTLPGINQVEVKEKIGLTFGRILRAILRQAPEIILIGEIRDLEAGGIAIQAALTGHLVFSTLHTNDAPSAIARLIDIGVKPFLVASSLQAIMAQRLIRVICPKCKITYRPNEKIAMSAGFSKDQMENLTFYKGEGCEECNFTGYKGRLGIFELLEMDSALRDLTFREAPLLEIRRQARISNMRTLKEDGMRKALRGVTTIEEVLRVTQGEVLV